MYDGKVIAKIGADQLARHYGHTSGAKLYEHYRKLLRQADRTGFEGSQLTPIIADITKIIPRLSSEAQVRAVKDRQTLLAKKEEK